jgi:hypothetical protein
MDVQLCHLEIIASKTRLAVTASGSRNLTPIIIHFRF